MLKELNEIMNEVLYYGKSSIKSSFYFYSLLNPNFFFNCLHLSVVLFWHSRFEVIVISTLSLYWLAVDVAKHHALSVFHCEFLQRPVFPQCIYWLWNQFPHILLMASHLGDTPFAIHPAIFNHLFQQVSCSSHTADGLCLTS